MNQPDRPLQADHPLHGDVTRLSLLSHDLRAAVSDIIGGLRLIDHSGFDHDSSLQLERVRAAGEVLARLLEEAFAAMEGDAGVPGPANVQMLRFLHDVEMRWSGRAREKGLAFRVAVAPDVPKVLALDRIALERALANILSNAIKYTDTGAVGLSVAVTDSGAIRIAVRDQGPGFSDAALARLFEYAARPEGTGKPGHGLGLHISRDMAERMGGAIVAVNLPGGGAELAIELPRESWEPDLPPPERPLPDLSRIKVLVAEDNPTNQTIFGHMLGAMGAEFEIAEDGVEALDWLEREAFDLALIDVEMPRLSGIDVIRALRARGSAHRQMPIIAATAYVLRANRDAIYAAGADAILAKPLPGITAFGQAVADALQRATGPVADAAEAAFGAAELNREKFDHLMEIAGADGARELLDRVSSDLRRAERGLVAGLTEMDLTAIRADTHVLISLAGAVGAEQLQALAEALNTSAHRHDDPATRRIGAEALAQLDRLIHFVGREVAHRGERA